MAVTVVELATRLQTTFKNVPNVTLTDCTEWVEMAVALHGAPLTSLEGNETYLVLLLAQVQGARNIALNSAHFFKFNDGDESVDKTMVTKQYMDVADALMAQYTQAKFTMPTTGNSGSVFKLPKRADR